jgi:hypothetical protein
MNGANSIISHIVSIHASVSANNEVRSVFCCQVKSLKSGSFTTSVRFLLYASQYTVVNTVHATVFGFFVMIDVARAGIICAIISHPLVKYTSQFHSCKACRIDFQDADHSSALSFASLYHLSFDIHWSRDSNLSNTDSNVSFLCSFIFVHISPSCMDFGNHTIGESP